MAAFVSESVGCLEVLSLQGRKGKMEAAAAAAACDNDDDNRRKTAGRSVADWWTRFHFRHERILFQYHVDS